MRNHDPTYADALVAGLEIEPHDRDREMGSLRD